MLSSVDIPQISSGALVTERYRLASVIGEGGMAVVWSAHDLTLGSMVAIKFLVRPPRGSEKAGERFVREARLGASVRHRNVIDIRDVGMFGAVPYMVMELLDGEALAERLIRDPPLTVREVLEIAKGVCDGLAAIHQAGIVHRDLKPENVFISQGDDGSLEVKVIDFGVSRVSDPFNTRRSALTTSEGRIVGTPEYMPPEQARGKRDIDHRVDLYALGVMLYECFCSHLPYDAEGVGDLILDIVSARAPSVVELRPEIGQPLSDVVKKAMAPDREDRFDNATEMKQAILDAQRRSPELDMSLRLAFSSERLDQRTSDRPIVRHSRRSTRGGPIPTPSTQPPPIVAVAETTSAIPPPPDEALPAGVPTSRLPLSLAVGAAVAALLAGGLYWVVSAETPSPNVAEAPLPAPTQPVAPTPAPLVEDSTPVPEEPPPAPREVHVTLRGVPAAGALTVDGRAAMLRGGQVALPADGAAHEIAVELDRRRWSVQHVAEADGDYEVELPSPPSARGGRRARSGAQDDAEEEEAPGLQRTSTGVFGELDY
ncbi:MAG: protein kinase [Sandaracinaceae bacterium]